MKDVIIYLKKRTVTAPNEESKKLYKDMIKDCEKCMKDAKELQELRKILNK